MNNSASSYLHCTILISNSFFRDSGMKKFIVIKRTNCSIYQYPALPKSITCRANGQIHTLLDKHQIPFVSVT